ncbi:hypothetical protein DXG01_002381, partial [Tephrocybe rancida]
HIREIWREMGWKSTVKARHFVLALRDYYLGGSHLPSASSDVQSSASSSYPQQLLSPPLTSEEALNEPSSYFPAQSSDADSAWAIAYVNVSYLQALSEAIDDDGSGFVNVREVNEFTTTRPQGWTVFQWLAYWAAGWQSSISDYTEKIYRLLLKIHNLRDKIRPDNLTALDLYLDEWCFYRLELLLRSTTKAETPITPELAKLRDDFCAAEELRLKNNLETIGYNIDSPGTVSLVTGPGRIERHHIKAIQLARTYTLHVDELDEKHESLGYVFSAFDSRLQDLSAIFKQMHIKPENHFKNYAFGMFCTSCGDLTWNVSGYKLSEAWDNLPREPGQDIDIDICPTNIPLTILKYDVQHPLDLPLLPPLFASELEEHPHDILGAWAGFCIKEVDGKSIPHEGLFRVVFGEESNDDGTLSGSANAYMGPLDMRYTISQSDQTQRTADFVMVYADGYWIRCVGAFEVATATISGDWYSRQSKRELPPTLGSGTPVKTEATETSTESDSDGQSFYSDSYETDSDGSSEGPRVSGTFQLTRTPASLARFRYTSEAFAENPAQARWSFARAAILHTIRRDNLSKSYVVPRLRDARRFVELHIKSMIHYNDHTEYSEFHDEELLELRELESTICPSIDQFYYSIATHLYNRLPYHSGQTCAGQFCTEAEEGKSIIQTRYMCIVCIDQSLTDTLDLCINCRATEETEDYPSHQVSHSLIRSHHFLHDCDRAWIVQEARGMSERIKTAFRKRSSAPGTNGEAAKPDSDVGDEDKDVFTCNICEKEVDLPCWVCVKCEPDRFVCSSCDKEHQMPSPPEKMLTTSTAQLQAMHAMHVMLWIRNDEDVSIPDDDQLTRVEDRLSAVEDLVQARLESMQQEVTTQFANVERQLGEHFRAMDITFGSVGERFERRISSLEARFDSLETLLRDFIVNSST